MALVAPLLRVVGRWRMGPHRLFRARNMSAAGRITASRHPVTRWAFPQFVDTLRQVIKQPLISAPKCCSLASPDHSLAAAAAAMSSSSTTANGSNRAITRRRTVWPGWGRANHGPVHGQPPPRRGLQAQRPHSPGVIRPSVSSPAAPASPTARALPICCNTSLLGHSCVGDMGYVTC
jgi:hypothetical protein